MIDLFHIVSRVPLYGTLLHGNKQGVVIVPTVGRTIADTLKAYGVTHLFGMEDPVHIFHALDRKAVRPVTVHDEKHAAIMAHGYAKATGRPGVCTATCGPGATNLITGLLEAFKSSIPVVALVQDIPFRNRGRHAASEIDHAASLAPFVKWVGSIDLAERAPEMVRHAFRIATTGRPGPVVVLCPADLMGVETDAAVYVESDYTKFPATRTRASRQSIERAAEVFMSAARPLIVAGGGALASGAWPQILELAERYRTPVATTMNGRGVIPDDHELSVGVLGTSTGGRYGRGKIANELLKEADTVLILGSRTGQICFSNWTLPGPGTKVIHADIDPTEIGRNFRTDTGLVGDIRETLIDLIEACRSRNTQANHDDAVRRIVALRSEWEQETAEVFASAAIPIRPERLLREISDRATAETLVVTDASYVTGWAMSHIDTRGNGVGQISPRGTGGIGWGLPAAIGAKLAAPSRPVICVTGDGGFGYVLSELETAARYGVNVVVVVFNNGTLGFQKHYEEKLFGTYVDCDFAPVNYAEIAKAMSCKGERITDPAAIGPAIDRALKDGKPYLLDVVIDANAMAPIQGLERETKAEQMH